MADLLSLLGAGGTVATRAKTATLQGQRAGREDQAADLLARIAQDRQAQQDARQARAAELNEKNLLDLIRERNEAPVPEAPRPQYDSARGGYVSPGQPFQPVQGLPAAKPTDAYEERSEGGGTAIYEGGRFSKWKVAPPSPVRASPRAPTDAQERSFNWSTMMEEAIPTLEKLDNKIRLYAVWAFLNTPQLLDPIANRLLTDDEQTYYNALRKFGAGVLRKETGAAFGKGELRDVFSRYGPMGGDQPGVTGKKREGRASYADAMRAMATPARKYYESVEKNGLPNVTEEEQLTGAPGELSPASPTPPSRAARFQKYGLTPRAP